MSFASYWKRGRLRQTTGADGKSAGRSRGLTVNKLEETARALGKMLRESPEYRRFVKASDLLEQDTELKNLLDELAEKERTIEEKMQKGTPVEAAEKHEVSQLREKTRDHPTYAEFLGSRSEYLILMRRVNEAVNEAAGADTESQNE